MEQNRKNLIMVIEDEKPLTMAIQKKLERAGFETAIAMDGAQALEVLKKLSSPPALIWLDYYLPSMSGLELLTKIKNDPSLKDIPVFVISNTAGPEKVSAMMGLGAKRYYLKAEKRLEEIIDEINAFLAEGNHE